GRGAHGLRHVQGVGQRHRDSRSVAGAQVGRRERRLSAAQVQVGRSFLMTITVSKEDYLKAIAEAEAEGQTVIPATLAHWLSVTRPAVTFALKRLTKDGLVSVKSDGHIRLTAQGREVAERTIVRHHLIERMLSEIFDMPWYEIHDEAERLEHAVSPAFEK